MADLTGLVAVMAPFLARLPSLSPADRALAVHLGHFPNPNGQRPAQPQVYSANRYELDLAPWPAIRAVAERAAEHPAFQAAHPNRQPDANPV